MESGKSNGRYSYRVQAYNASGCGVWSASKTVVVTHPPASAPSLSVPSVDNNGSYNISWGAVSTATSYLLQERKGSGSWSKVYDSSGRSKKCSGRTDDSYRYRVRAYSAGGCSGWSATHTVSVTVIPAAPTGVAIDANGGSYKFIPQYLVWDDCQSRRPL